MTTQELFTFDKSIPEETFYLLGFFRWQDLYPHATLIKDKDNNLIKLDDENLAKQTAKAFAAKYCKESVDDGTIYCSVVLHITRGGGLDKIKDEAITCFTADREFSYQEVIRNLETLFIERGICEV
jgi:hypothetical protein